jgi:hypothetical protein
MAVTLAVTLAKGLGSVPFCGVQPRPSDEANAKRQCCKTITVKQLTVYKVRDAR